MLDLDVQSKSFRSADGSIREVLRGLAFHVPDGHLACLVGPSGCGKTTTLRLILGLDNDYTGNISMPDDNRRIGCVFQEPRLLPWRTVETNVRLALPRELQHRELDDLFITLGLDGMENFFPGELSLGLARRVAIARALAVEPALLLLDEPFVSLDEARADRLRSLLITVWSARPTTTLMVTHNLKEAVMLADRIIVLSKCPATVRGVFPVDVPRQRRDPQTIAALLADIAGAFPPEESWARGEPADFLCHDITQRLGRHETGVTTRRR